MPQCRYQSYFTFEKTKGLPTKYWPVKVCLRYTQVAKPISILSTQTSRNGRQLSFSSSSTSCLVLSDHHPAISNSFTFAKTMRNLVIDPNVFMCCSDVSSLFTNISLDKTIKICSEAGYDKSDSQPSF